jgi:subtilisin family serine protease
MKRYIVNKKALDVLNRTGIPAQEKLMSTDTITDETLIYSNLDFVSIVLSKNDIKLLNQNNLYPIPEHQEGKLLASNYEKVRSSWVKTQKKLITGVGCKVAIMDTGCNTSVVGVDYSVNFANADPNVSGNPAHGTFVNSIIKSSVGLANRCELHFLKVIGNANEFNESAFLAGLDYCIDNNIDIINMSFSYTAAGFLAAIPDVISAGIVISAAAGNSTSDFSVDAPATLPNVVSVNSIKEDGNPQYKNVVLRNDLYSGSHGITVACSGVGCEGINSSGTTTTSNGTSFSSPFFVGTFALYKELTGYSDNYEVLEYMYSKLLKHTNTTYFGKGLVNF